MLDHSPIPSKLKFVQFFLSESEAEHLDAEAEARRITANLLASLILVLRASDELEILDRLLI
tara:strand:- start:92 stop:277 length:186 start_codon:yes stop_codon:yes gene_type:complete